MESLLRFKRLIFLFVRWDFGYCGTTGLLYQPRMIDEGDCGGTGGMKIGRRKPAPAPLCQPQIPHDYTTGLNPGSRGGKPATNHLSYGAARLKFYFA
jgi:hypothetical protein